ncbi:MAG: M3 family oligoendopeptidase [Clostridiales bacterium]|nr:M3 family oligoendopeptidase [Clostridiales bacterium]
MDRWSLVELYKGYNDIEYIKDLESLTKVVEEYKVYTSNLDVGSPEETLLALIGYEEKITVLSNKLGAFASLNQSVDTTDTETVAQLDKIKRILSEINKPKAISDKYIGKVKSLEEIISNNEKLNAHKFFLMEIQKVAKHTLSDDVEDVIGKLDLSGGSAWEDMRDYLASTMEVDYKGEKITLSAVRNLAYSSDPKVRKEAYEAELASYEKIKDAVSYSLNNIKFQVNTISELRAYESPLDMTLESSKMQKTTLMAMLGEMEAFMPKFREYLKRKAELLGHKNGLPFYDLFAPLSEKQREFTVEEARDYLLKHFGSFSEDLFELVERAFEEEWIDFFPRKGKVGGAFCANLSVIKQSRVLTNFDGTLSSVITLAHELGHAYHGYLIEDHLPLNTDYSMPVAETASTFNEAIIMNAAISEASGSEKMALIESQLQDVTQIIVDIYSRFLFESEVFKKRETGFMFSDELENMMLDAQKKAYGDGLNPDYLHPYMWVNKGHYYSSSLSFYNFPYAFGGLFARGLYAKYQAEGSSFVEKYKKLLRGTTVSSVEDVAKIADIDLTKSDFWKESLQSYAGLIDEFIELSK